MERVFCCSVQLTTHPETRGGILSSVCRMCVENFWKIKKGTRNFTSTTFTRGVLLPGAPDRAYLINKLIKQQEQIYHLHL